MDGETWSKTLVIKCMVSGMCAGGAVERANLQLSVPALSLTVTVTSRHCARDVRHPKPWLIIQLQDTR